MLQKIGAADMASFVAQTLLSLGDLTRLQSKEEWLDHYQSLPDEVHEDLETLTRPFLELEGRFLELAYVFARAHWEQVRPGNQ